MRQVILRSQKSCRAGVTWSEVLVTAGVVTFFLWGFAIWVLTSRSKGGAVS